MILTKCVHTYACMCAWVYVHIDENEVLIITSCYTDLQRRHKKSWVTAQMTIWSTICMEVKYALQCFVLCYSMLQCVAVCCSSVQWVTAQMTIWSTICMELKLFQFNFFMFLTCFIPFWTCAHNKLHVRTQHVAVSDSPDADMEHDLYGGSTYVAVCCSVLQCVAVCCSVLQCAAVCYSLRQLEWRFRARFVWKWNCSLQCFYIISFFHEQYLQKQVGLWLGALGSCHISRF